MHGDGSYDSFYCVLEKETKHKWKVNIPLQSVVSVTLNHTLKMVYIIIVLSLYFYYIIIIIIIIIKTDFKFQDTN